MRNKAIKLSDLLTAGGVALQIGSDPLVRSITLDSRAVEPGDVFFALQGGVVHGAQYIDVAVANGAVAVVHDGLAPMPLNMEGCAAVEVPRLRNVLGDIAAQFFATSSTLGLGVMAVTGTNGKTSVCMAYAQLSEALGRTCGTVGTLGWGIPPQLDETGLTTPDVITLHSTLAAMQQQGAKSFSIEASSHALSQGRLASVPVRTAIFTNLSRDHLDYHGDFSTYGQAKSRLFSWPGLRNIVINADDEFSVHIQRAAQYSEQCIRYSLVDSKADVFAENIKLTDRGITATVHTPWGDGILQLQQIGRFNLQNILAVISALCIEGENLQAVLDHLPKLQASPGRMQVFGPDQGPRLVVDYAHTPDALEQVLRALNEHCDAHLWLVFGCGGDRDRGKRPQMAAIAARYAEHIVVTSDNPRSEEPQSIIDDIMAGIPTTGASCLSVNSLLNRRAAIEHAVHKADQRDWVLIAGKGHEKFQQHGDQKLPFDDVLIAEAALQGRAAAAGTVQ